MKYAEPRDDRLMRLILHSHQWRNHGGGKWAIAHFIWRFAHCNFY
jgi:hypothetical protein